MEHSVVTPLEIILQIRFVISQNDKTILFFGVFLYGKKSVKNNNKCNHFLFIAFAV